jgi:hypothetical protein
MPFVIEILLVLAVLGFCFWLLNRFVPIASPFKEIMWAVVAFALIIWLLDGFGIVHTGAFSWHGHHGR